MYAYSRIHTRPNNRSIENSVKDRAITVSVQVYFLPPQRWYKVVQRFEVTVSHLELVFVAVCILPFFEGNQPSGTKWCAR